MKIFIVFVLILSVTGCSDIPTTSQLVLMAESRKDNTQELTPAKTVTPFNTACNSADGNKLDFNGLLKRVEIEAKKQHSGITTAGAAKQQSGITCNKITDQVIKAETGLTCDEIKQAAELLKSGQFRSDIRGLVFLAISTLPNLAQTLPQSGMAIQNEVDVLTSKQPEILDNCRKAILNGNSCPDLNIFQRLYDDPTAKLKRDTLVALLENKSFRLALIVYAHSNGVDIDNADLDFLQSQLEQTDIDIQALVDAGKDRLKQKYKTEAAEARIDALTSSCK